MDLRNADTFPPTPSPNIIWVENLQGFHHTGTVPNREPFEELFVVG